MCIRDSPHAVHRDGPGTQRREGRPSGAAFGGEVLLRLGDCLLYTSDAADERSSVDLGGRRIIKKKNTVTLSRLDKNIQDDLAQNDEMRSDRQR